MTETKPRYSPKTNEGECIFCEFGRGTGPTGSVFWEDDKYKAFLSGWPNTKGFTVVMTKDHYGGNVLEMPDDKLQDFILAAKKVAGILLKCFDDVGRVGLIMEGMGVDHAHIKLYPMHGTGDLKSGEWKQHLSRIRTYFEKYPGYMASNDGPEADIKEIEELVKKLKEIEK